MFKVWEYYRFKEYHTISEALDAARIAALYGNCSHVEVTYDDQLIASFQARRIRDAARQERETRSVPVFPRVLPGL